MGDNCRRNCVAVEVVVMAKIFCGCGCGGYGVLVPYARKKSVDVVVGVWFG